MRSTSTVAAATLVGMGKNSLRPPGKDERAVGFAGQGADGRNGDGAFIALGGKVGDIEEPNNYAGNWE